MTGAEAAKQAADRAEAAAARPIIYYNDESDEEEGILIPGTPPGLQAAPGVVAGESQGGTTITLSLRTPERLRGPPDLVPALAHEPEASPEAQGIANKLYRDSQYEL
jgi:hypothetical protein